ncbi:hypothetical protein HDU99_003736 [Rhizoclosmatium hyalinum]|nr:hypothetical protein HDU99_003736 [Rhizoclosmatium hyalinum]
MQTKVASLEENLNLTRNENENLTNKLREATVDLQTEKFLRNEMHAKIKDLEKSLAESQENESELNLCWSDIKALQEKNSESIKLIEKLEKELAESRAKIDLQKELHLNQTNSLKDEISSIKFNEQNLSLLLRDLQRKYEASETVGKTELDEVRNNLNLLTVENEKLVKELSERRDHDSVEIQSLQVKLAEAQTISQKEASRNQALESRIKSFDFEIEALKQKVVLAETQTQAAVVQKEELKTQILNLQTERSFLESKHMSEIKVLQVEITKSQLEDAEQAANHAAEVEALKQTVELKTSQVEKAISEKEELDNRLLNLQSELTALESRHKTEHDQLTSKITKLQQLSTNQETQINSLTLQLSTKTTETTSLKTNLSTLETTTETLHSTIKTLQTNLATFHSTYTTLETQKQNLADVARQIPPLRASLTLTHRRASHTIKHLLTTISTLTQDRVAALQQVETLTRELKARCGSVSKEGRVLETQAVWRGDDMFGRWCFDRGVGKENAVRMRVGEYERIRRERAERCGAGEGGGKGEGGGEVEDGLVERYQFLVNTVRGVREMFSE